MNLNQWNRPSLVKAVLAASFKDREAELIEKRKALANDIYNAVFDEKERRKMKRLPAGYLPTVDSIQVTFGASNTTRISFSGGNFYDPDAHTTTRHRFVHPEGPVGRLTLANVGERVLFDHADGPKFVLRIRYQKLLGEQQALYEEIAEAEAEVSGIIGSYRTTEKLAEAWPEIKPYLSEMKMPTADPNAPAIRVEAVNARLGLPKDQAAA